MAGIPWLLAARSFYRAGQSAVLHQDYTIAGADFQKAKSLTSDPDQQAWADYQLACIEVAQPSHKPQAIAALERFCREYPHHYLAAQALNDLDRLEGVKPAIPQLPELDTDCGPECLQYLLKHSFHRSVSVASLRIVAGTGAHGTTLLGLQKAAEQKGLKASGMQVDLNYIRRMRNPLIAWTKRSHFVAVIATPISLHSPFWSVRVYDPAGQGERNLTPSEFQREWDGYILTLS